MPDLHQDTDMADVSEVLRWLHRNDARGGARRRTIVVGTSAAMSCRTQLSGKTTSAQELICLWFDNHPPTGSSVGREDLPEVRAAVTPPHLAKDQVALITRFIGLGKSHVASLLHVSRQTLYDWLKGVMEPTGDHARRVAMLARVMAPACVRLQRPLFHGYITTAPKDGETSIQDLLAAAVWDESALRAAFLMARQRTDVRDRELGLDGPTVTRAVGEDRLLENSIALGLE
jgi:hypothetical protein